jgi:hypothetical protein
MLAAELAYLDGDLETALSVADLNDEEVRQLSRRLRITLFDNRIIVQLFSPQNLDRDEKRRHWDEKEENSNDDDGSDELVDALRAARAGKHFEALPQLRSYLARSYWLGDWRLFRDAAAELSRELLTLEDLPQAAYMAMLACNEESIKAVATQCVGPAPAAAVRSAIEQLLRNGELRQHARMVAVFLRDAADAVPDDLVNMAADYLLRWASLDREFMTPLNESTAAWEALRQLGKRVDEPTANRAIDVALKSKAWRQAPPALDRQEIVKACARLVLSCSSEGLPSLVDEIAALTRAERRSHDYQDVLQLLWRVSSTSPEAKDAVATSLFPASETSVPGGLLQLGKLLGKKLQRPEELDALGERLADRVRKQVMVVRPGAEPPPVDGFGIFSFDEDAGRVFVQLSNFGPTFEGALAYVEDLSQKSVDAIVDACAEMISSPFNALANKSELVHYLGRLAKRVAPQRLSSLIGLLKPIAGGQIADRIGDVAGNAGDPLNPFKFNVGTVADLQGWTIIALAQLDKSHPGQATDDIQEIVASGLAHTDPTVRQMSYVAAGWLSALSESIVTGLLVGTRDAAPEAAASALRVFAFSDAVVASGPQVDYLIQAIHAGSFSREQTVRANAAAAVQRLTRQDLSAAQRGQLNEIRSRLQMDTLHSVRSGLSKIA